MKRKKILLMTPPYHCGVVESAGRWPNLGLLYIAEELKNAGFKPIYYDAMSLFHTIDDISAHIEKVTPDVVAITSITAAYPISRSVLVKAKEINSSIVTVIGGIHPSFCYREILEESEEIDYCVIGEGELTLPELLHVHFKGGDLSAVQGIALRQNGQVIANPARDFIQDLDSLHPAWELVDFNDYPLYFIENSRVAIVSSSRGCIHQCSFCSQREFWKGTYREREPISFVSEIEYLVREHNVNAFFIADEYPTRNRERWIKILDSLIEKKLGINILMETCVIDIIRDADILDKYREAGVMFVYMGVEAASQERLDEFNKSIKIEDSRKALKLVKNAGMICESSLLVGMPDETPESIERTLELAKLYDAHYMHFLFITPWPYVSLWKDLQPHIEEYDYSKYNLVHPVVRPLAMTRDELFQRVLHCYKEYYNSKMFEWYALPKEDFRRRCLLLGLKAIFENSFLKQHMDSMEKMPEKLKNIITKIFEDV